MHQRSPNAVIRRAGAPGSRALMFLGDLEVGLRVRQNATKSENREGVQLKEWN